MRMFELNIIIIFISLSRVVRWIANDNGEISIFLMIYDVLFPKVLIKSTHVLFLILAVIK